MLQGVVRTILMLDYLSMRWNAILDKYYSEYFTICVSAELGLLRTSCVFGGTAFHSQTYETSFNQSDKR